MSIPRDDRPSGPSVPGPGTTRAAGAIGGGEFFQPSDQPLLPCDKRIGPKPAAAAGALSRRFKAAAEAMARADRERMAARKLFLGR